MQKRLLQILGLAVFVFSLFASGYVSHYFISRDDAPRYQEVAEPADYLFLLDRQVDFAIEGYGTGRGVLGNQIEDILNNPAGWKDTSLSFDFDISTLRYKIAGIDPDYGELGVEMVFYLTKDRAELVELCGPNAGGCIEKKTEDYTPMFNAPCLIILESSRYMLGSFRANLNFSNIGTINHEVGHCLGLSHGKYGAVSKYSSSKSAYPALSDIQAVQKAIRPLIDELGYDYVNGKDFGEDGISVASKDDKSFHIYPDGSRLYKEEYEWVSSDVIEGIAIAKESDKYFHITMDGNPIYEERYDEIQKFYDGRSRVQENGQYFHITMDGKPLYEERYDYITNFKEGLARARQDGKEFHIKIDGELLYEEKYDHVLVYVGGLFLAYNDTDEGEGVFVACINKQGEIVATEKKDC